MTSKEQVYENLRSNGLEPELVQALVDLAISEDLMGGTDVTSLATIPEIQISELDLVTRSSGVIAGAFKLAFGVGGKAHEEAKVERTQKDIKMSFVMLFIFLTLVAVFIFLIFSQASIPSISGIITSIMMSSGICWRMSSSAFLPLSASIS